MWWTPVSGKYYFKPPRRQVRQDWKEKMMFELIHHITNQKALFHQLFLILATLASWRL
tara:strand:- start:636 stop:809 length:174 start_codon:yes stop_codon:yes gene_type:complete